MRLIRLLRNKSWTSLKSQHHKFITCGFFLIFILFVMYTLLQNSDPTYIVKEYYRKKNILPVVKSDYDTGNVRSSRQILFWTSLIREEGEGLKAFCMKSDELQNCPYKCDFTTNRSQLETADAVVFDCRNLQLKKKTFWESMWTGFTDETDDMPTFRMHRQFWVFHMMEAPVHTWRNLKPFEGLFNWTMTYRRDSDVYIPYGRLLPKDKENTGIVDNITRSIINEKTKLAAITMSNCRYQPSKRLQYLKELQQYMHIDFYGKCGTLKCPTFNSHVCKDPVTCYEYLGPQYKFYLAFENSLCVDYITEKFYTALRFGMVPVVYGYGDYSKVAPKGSYIEARSFESPKRLAEYLLFLDKNPEEYSSYFEWRKDYRVHDVYYFEDAWCSLCKKLWEDNSTSYGQSPSARDLVNWWYHTSESERACLHRM